MLYFRLIILHAYIKIFKVDVNITIYSIAFSVFNCYFIGTSH